VKGIELPINILVIVAIAVIVLLGMVALYFTGWSPFGGTVGIESIKNSACIDYARNNDCTPDPATIPVNYDVDGDGTIDVANDNLQEFAEAFYGCSDGDVNCVRQLCACPGY
jgi:hypothetical protein